jgi:hypothetical protein
VTGRALEELDRRSTPLGEIVLRRRVEPSRQVDVYEVRLGDEFLMSSLFTVSETALADLALGRCDEAGEDGAGEGLDVLVGGLGLGYTARAALRDRRVRSLYVVEAIDAVIDWHRNSLVPNAAELTGDARCHLVHGDFFCLIDDVHVVAGGPDRYDAILVDIDHTPRRHLHPRHRAFYTPDGLRRVAHHLNGDGVFALWSDAAPDADFIDDLERVFPSTEAHVVTFPNFYTGEESASTVYLASAT